MCNRRIDAMLNDLKPTSGWVLAAASVLALLGCADATNQGNADLIPGSRWALTPWRPQWVEAEYFEVLRAASSYRVDGDLLIIETDSGSSARFVALSP